MSGPSAKVVLDSVSPAGHRLTTIEVKFHRFVLAEINTHRAFSRNSASSRAIPVKKQIQRVLEDPAMPVSWPSEKPGMQGGVQLEGDALEQVQTQWLRARDQAVEHVEALVKAGLHKSLTNRLLEPWMWQTAIISSTEWDNFWRQRCSPLAQPELRAAAELMRDALDASMPQLVDLDGWHMPYLRPGEFDDSDEPQHVVLKRARQVSVGRNCRVSYLNHDGVRDLEADVKLYKRLVTDDPPHASPLEHVATPARPGERVRGNFSGWHQLRHIVLGDS